ncbi:radical SAM protein [Candidatus Woesearchaeota archaeon]|nr:radical SAM protein [Candidatus Woesearchaeota archaeon]
MLSEYLKEVSNLAFIMIAQNQYHSFNLGELPSGCRYCVKGEKLVLFVTGLCPRRCYFCPVSDAKFDQDVTFANERKVEKEEDLLEEAKAMNAFGAGFTGGDPLTKIERTIQYIRKLKESYGSEFHIHLYTSLNLVTREKLQRLCNAGLDEIRFHFDLDSTLFWKNLEIAQEFPWKTGVELPLLPSKKKELKEVIDFIGRKVDFLVLNELEIADNSQSKLCEMGFETKDTLSYAVKGSLEVGLGLLEYIKKLPWKLPAHLCTAKLKDGIQLTNRLQREGKNVKKKFDVVTPEGMLIRGALYLPELAPGFSYRKKLAEAPKEKLLSQLFDIQSKIKRELSFTDEDFFVDQNKIRLLLSAKNLRKYHATFKKYHFLLAIVKEYPTADQLEIEVDFV